MTTDIKDEKQLALEEQRIDSDELMKVLDAYMRKKDEIDAINEDDVEAAELARRLVMDRAVRERDFSQQVYDLARLRGWLVFRVYDSRRSPAGWPDIFAVRGERAVAAELKREGKTPAPMQIAWLEALAKVPGIETTFWTPSMWDELERVLA